MLTISRPRKYFRVLLFDVLSQVIRSVTSVGRENLRVRSAKFSRRRMPQTRGGATHSRNLLMLTCSIAIAESTI